MKSYSIVIRIDNRITDVINYKAERRTSEKELALAVKFMNHQVCNIKSVERISNHKIIITSTKDTTYMVAWTNVTTWDESELED